ncbi:MAG: serine/threonine protein kinase [Deltaproteobacteria bacterium]|nr:serine/threonine protein kinase [Deltaproteobacteria bacterium]
MSGGPKERIGQIIGDRFRIDAFIGKGSMADVYRALDLTTSAFVALKILRRQIDDGAGLQRFAREGEVQARLRHRNVAALLATGVTANDEPYLVVELLRGKTLRGALKAEGRVTPRRAASYAWQALQGLSAVHAQGILHRDLKPANIMLEPSPGPVERVVLIDFGFATFEGSAKLTQQGTVVGSLTYIAPERLRGEPPDPRSDLYAIGVIAYELLAGAPPFTGGDDFDLIEMHLNAPPPSLRLIDPTIPADLDAILARSLAKHQDERFPDAATMANAIEAAARSIP